MLVGLLRVLFRRNAAFDTLDVLGRLLDLGLTLVLYLTKVVLLGLQLGYDLDRLCMVALVCTLLPNLCHEDLLWLLASLSSVAPVNEHGVSAGLV